MVVLAIGVSPAVATTVTYGGADDYGRSAQAAFTFDGAGGLMVRLTNTATAQVADNAFVLTAVFFDLMPPTTLTPSSALLTPATTFYPASKVYMNGSPMGSQPSGGVVGGEWSYAQGTLAWGGNQGISSSGLGLFSPSGNFPGDNLAGPVSVDGVQYGIVGPGGIALRDDGTGADGLKNQPYIQNAVDFTLAGVPSNVPELSNVVFQYGTDLAEPHFVGGQAGGNIVPEPLRMLAAGSGLGGLAGYIRRRRMAW
jgi:hypothetical protein